MTDILYGSDMFLDENNDIRFTPKDDFKLIESIDNLKQAIKSKLNTTLGELTLHPNYGSELNGMIGNKSNETTLASIKQMVRKTLLQEPRIKENGIKTISVYYPDVNDRTKIEISIKVQPIESQEDINMIYPYFLS